MHNSNVMVHFSATTSNEDEWSGEDIRGRPKVVRRGIDDFESEINDGRKYLCLLVFLIALVLKCKVHLSNIFNHLGEPSQIDHLVFVVHGIGPYADLKFRSLIECGKYIVS